MSNHTDEIAEGMKDYLEDVDKDNLDKEYDYSEDKLKTPKEIEEIKEKEKEIYELERKRYLSMLRDDQISKDEDYKKYQDFLNPPGTHHPEDDYFKSPEELEKEDWEVEGAMNREIKSLSSKINELIALADSFDTQGLSYQANKIDQLIKKLSNSTTENFNDDFKTGTSDEGPNKPTFTPKDPVKIERDLRLMFHDKSIDDTADYLMKIISDPKNQESEVVRPFIKVIKKILDEKLKEEEAFAGLESKIKESDELAENNYKAQGLKLSSRKYASTEIPQDAYELFYEIFDIKNKIKHLEKQKELHVKSVSVDFGAILKEIHQSREELTQLTEKLYDLYSDSYPERRINEDMVVAARSYNSFSEKKASILDKLVKVADIADKQGNKEVANFMDRLIGDVSKYSMPHESQERLLSLLKNL